MSRIIFETPMKNLGYIIGLLTVNFLTTGFAQLILNGSFENGTLPPSSSGFPETLDPTVALPNWNISGSPLYYQGGALGGPVVAITSSASTSDGTNSVYLQAGFGGATTPVSLWQDLSIPAYAKAITFQSKPLYDPNLYPAGYYLALLVSAAGVSVAPTSLSADSSGFNSYAIDVTAYAGSSMELRFSVDPLGDSARGGAYQIDNIRYSTTPTPEPGTVALLGLCAATIGIHRCRKSKSL
jgi:hypothetical protein